MRIELERSGGVAGAILRTSLDTRSLPGEEKREWEALVHDADLFSGRAPSRGGAPSRGRPDRFEYRVRITDEHGQREVGMGEGELTDAQRRLVERLMQQLRSRRRQGG